MCGRPGDDNFFGCGTFWLSSTTPNKWFSSPSTDKALTSAGDLSLSLFYTHTQTHTFISLYKNNVWKHTKKQDHATFGKGNQRPWKAVTFGLYWLLILNSLIARLCQYLILSIPTTVNNNNKTHGFRERNMVTSCAHSLNCLFRPNPSSKSQCTQGGVNSGEQPGPRGPNPSQPHNPPPTTALFGTRPPLPASNLCIDQQIWLTWKDSDAGKDWRQTEKEKEEDKMVR